MKKRIMMIIICLAAVFGMTTGGFAANSFVFTETYQQKGNCFIMWNIPFCDVGAVSGKFAITNKISLNGIDISKFNENTKIVVEAGGLFFEGLLDDDMTYSAGKTSFNVSYVERNEDTYKPVKYITLNLKWTSKLLTVKISGITPDFISPLVADKYIGDASGKISDNTIGYFAMGDDVYAGFHINYSGSVSTKSTKTKTGSETVTSKVTVKGTGTETSEDFRGSPEESTAAAGEPADEAE